MKKILFLSIFFLGFLASNSFALYVDVPSNLQDQPGLTPAYYTFNDGTYSHTNSYAGAFVLNFKEDVNSSTYFSTYGFCVDLTVGDGSGDVVLNSITTDAYKKAAWLLNRNYNSGNTIYQNAGLQMAIWDVLYDETFFVATDNGSTVYNAYLSYRSDFDANTANILSDFDAFADKYVIVDFDNSNFQDMITTNPVPEPATMALFGLGLLGITLVGRKRR